MQAGHATSDATAVPALSWTPLVTAPERARAREEVMPAMTDLKQAAKVLSFPDMKPVSKKELMGAEIGTQLPI